MMGALLLLTTLLVIVALNWRTFEGMERGQLLRWAMIWIAIMIGGTVLLRVLGY